jgi:hypothetical protein
LASLDAYRIAGIGRAPAILDCPILVLSVAYSRIEQKAARSLPLLATKTPAYAPGPTAISPGSIVESPLVGGSAFLATIGSGSISVTARRMKRVV